MYVECPLHCFSLISSIYEIIRIGLTKTMNNQDKKKHRNHQQVRQKQTQKRVQGSH